MSNEGTVRCGPFELTEHVGSGGMAQVWRAEHVRHGEPAAVKIVDDLEFPGDPDLEARFADEVRTHANLRHPAIVHVFDHGRVDEEAEAASEGKLSAGRPFLAMEYADRGTVEDLAKPVDWPTCAALTRDLLDGLAYVHARDLVHRDLKPGNVLASSVSRSDGDSGIVFKLSDFGIAHAFDALERRTGDDLDLERDYVSRDAGTPIYMAPEQFLGEWRRFGPWTDLYQLGMILWELTCGDPAYEADSSLEYGMCHVRKPLPSFEPFVDVPPGFEAWIGGLLEKSPESRFQRAADAAWHFERITSSGRSEPPATVPLAEPESRTELGPTETTELDAKAPTLAYLETLGTTGAEPGALSTVSDSGALETSEHETSEMTSRSPPPIPGSWKTPDRPDSRALRLDAGLGMFGVREAPMVGRERQRDILWEELRAAAEREVPRVVVLEGASGVGRSKLARWLGERAGEVGAIAPLTAYHGQPSAPRRGLVERASDHDRLERHHARCAALLTELDAPEDAPNEARRAWHLEAAGRRDEAVDALLEAAERACDLANLRRVERYADTVDRWLEGLEVESDDLRRLQVRFLRAECDGADNPERALKRVDRLKRDLGDERRLELWGRVRFLRAKVLIRRGRDRAAFEELDGAVESVVDAGHLELAARMTAESGTALHRIGEHERANDRFRRAERLRSRAGTGPHLRRHIALSIALVQIELDDFDAAESLLTGLEANATDSGDLECILSAWNARGECERFRRNWNEALHYYRQNFRWARRNRDRRRILFGLLNSMLLYVFAERFDEAAEQIEELDRELGSDSDPFLEITARIAQLACCAAADDWDGWDSVSEDLEALLERTSVRHRDQAATGEIAAGLAAEAGKTERARHLYRICRAIWSDLGSDGAAARIDEKLEHLS